MSTPRTYVSLGNLMDEQAENRSLNHWSETVALEALDEAIANIGSVCEVFKDYDELIDLPLSREGERAIRAAMGLTS